MKRNIRDIGDISGALGARATGTVAEALGAIQRLRAAAAAVVERLIDLIDAIEGDPDLEPDADISIEDLPHDQVDEGNDEPSLATSEAGGHASRAWCIDGEMDESEEQETEAA